MTKWPKAGLAALAVSLAVAGCQSGDGTDALDLSGNAGANTGAQVTESELRADCPPVELRQGTAFFNTYERGGEGDGERLIYQASIADVTRSCTFANGMMNLTVAAAGRIVPGPKGRAGSIDMPIRVVVMQEGQVPYSQLHRYPVTVADTIGATQFVFTDPSISLQMPVAERTRIVVGYDEGPYDTP